MVETVNKKYDEAWASGKCTEEQEGKYVKIIVKGGEVCVPFEWMKFHQVPVENEDNANAGEELQAVVITGFVYDFITTEDADFENFPHEVTGCETHDYEIAVKAMEYFQIKNENGDEDCYCPPPLKKKESGNHL